MKKHNCLKWVEEGQGCSICHNSLLAHTGKDWLEAIEKTNWVIVEQKKQIEQLESYVKLLKESRRKYQRLLGEEHKKSIDERMKDADNFMVAIMTKQKFVIAELESQMDVARTGLAQISACTYSSFPHSYKELCIAMSGIAKQVLTQLKEKYND
jgi:hypothetical protein